jgi:hypothetical protein
MKTPKTTETDIIASESVGAMPIPLAEPRPDDNLAHHAAIHAMPIPLAEQRADAALPPVVYTESAMATGDYVRSDNGVTLKIRKRVAMPVLPFGDGMTIVVRIMEAIKLGKELTVQPNGKPKMEPAHVTTVSSLSGEQRTLICGAVLRKELEECYPGDKYVGCWFHIHRLPRREGKTYSTFVINEIEPPTEDQMAERLGETKQIAA